MSVCFTSGEGPARVGSLCALPFTYKGSSYTTCASLREVLPIGLDTESRTEFPSTWCSIMHAYNESVAHAWGFCGSCIDKSVFESLPDATSAGKKFTLSGCTCADVWKLPGYEPCKSACCAPDNDDKAWCVAEDPSCEGTGWGYCKDPEALQRSGLEEKTWFDEVTFFTDITQAPTAGSESPTLAPTTREPSAGTEPPTTLPPTAQPTGSDTSAPSGSTVVDTSTPSGNGATGFPTTLFPSSAPSSTTDTVQPTLFPVGGSAAPTAFDTRKRTLVPTSLPTQLDDQAPIIILTIFLVSFFAAAGVLATRRFLALYEDRDQKKREEAEANPSESVSPSDEGQPGVDDTKNRSEHRANKAEGEPIEATKQVSSPTAASKAGNEESAADLISTRSWSQRLRLKVENRLQGSTKIKVKTGQEAVQGKTQEEIQDNNVRESKAKETQDSVPNGSRDPSSFAPNHT